MKLKHLKKKDNSLATKITSGVSSAIRNQDVYGKPVTFNFNGQETFKTVPGGLLSMVAIVFIMAYAILKLKYMFAHAEWSIVQQTVIQDDSEVEVPHSFADYPNVSLALQFNFHPEKKEPKKSRRRLIRRWTCSWNNNASAEFRAGR